MSTSRARAVLALAAIFSGTLFPTPRSSAAQAMRLDLSDCIHLALTHATEVLKSQNELSLSGEALLQSYAQFLPTIDVSTGATYGWGNQYYTFTSPVLVNSRSLSAQYELSTQLNLFNGLSDIAAFRAAVRKKESAVLTLTRAKQEVATDVTQSYYQIILDHRILEIDQKNLQVMLDREKLINVQLEVGSASAADAAQQTAQARLALSTVISARQKLQDDQVLLIQKLRIDPAGDYEFEDFNPAVQATLLPPLREMASAGLNDRADLASEFSLAQRANDEVDVARGDYFPKLNLGLSLLGNGATLYSQYVDGVNNLPPSQNGLFPQLGDQISYAVSLTLSWNLLDHGLTRYAVSQARVAAENSEIDYEDTRIAVLSQIRQVRGDYAAAAAALTAAQNASVAAEKAYRVISGRYRVGASSLVDLITAQAGWIQAQSSEAQAQIGLAFQSKLVEYYEGKTPIE